VWSIIRFILREFLIQREKGKMEIKIIEVIIRNLEIFGENFIIFGPREIFLKIKRIEKGWKEFCDWLKGASRYNLGS
jgi:hypothetical protein